MQTSRTLPVGFDHIWQEIRIKSRRSGRGAWFLDRDGTVIVERDYLSDPAGVELIPGAGAAIAAANQAGLAVVLVTNQSGIGRGYFGWDDFAAVQEAMLQQLAAQGARIDAVYACPFHPAAAPPLAHPDHPDRKPRPGMILRGLAALELDPLASLMVGDKPEDLAAGRAAGLAAGVLVTTGHGPGQAASALALAQAGFAVTVRESLAGLEMG